MSLMILKKQISALLKEATEALGIIIPEDKITLSFPQHKQFGDLSTNLPLTIAKDVNQNPQELAQKIVANITDGQKKKLQIEKIDIVAPGFINFTIATEYYTDLLSTKFTEDTFGTGDNLAGKRIMMEYAHPNPFKSFHIGHLRNIILGESLIRLLENQGAEVIRVNYQGDVGMHIAKCLWSFMKVDPSLYPQASDEKVALLGKCYAEGATAFEENEESKKEIKEVNKNIYTKEDPKTIELWNLGKQWSMEKLHEIYKRVGSHFVKEYMETEVTDLGLEKVQIALDKGILKKSDGAIIFDGAEYGLDTRVFLSSEGLPTYEGKELGIAYREFTDFGKIDLCIHNVAVEQISFFKVTFKVEELLDETLFKGKQYHNAYEFVGLKKGKMSSRKGDVILGNDILNEARDRIRAKIKDESTEHKDQIAETLGVGSIKYSFLKISPKTYLAFDIDESVNTEGDSAPYIMYAYTRAQGILNQVKKTGNNKLEAKEISEIMLVKHIAKFPLITLQATNEYAPHSLAAYLYDLAQLFSRFYTECPVLSIKDSAIKESRIGLTAATAQVLKKGLYLLGIETIDKM